MRYSFNIGAKASILKAALEGQYRFVMLGLMIVEVILLFVLVVKECLR